MTKALSFAAALVLPVLAQAQGTALTCKSARLALELEVPLSNAVLVGPVTMTRTAQKVLEVPSARVRDLQVTGSSVSFTAVDESGANTILKFEATKNEYDRYVGYMLFNSQQISLVCTTH